MLSLAGLSHDSKAVRCVVAIGLLSALGLLFLAWGSGEFPGLRHAQPLRPWMIGVAGFSALAAFVGWYRTVGLVVFPMAASIATMLLVGIAAHFPLSPLVWGNLVSVAVAVWWVAAGRFSGRDA